MLNQVQRARLERIQALAAGDEPDRFNKIVRIAAETLRDDAVIMTMKLTGGNTVWAIAPPQGLVFGRAAFHGMNLHLDLEGEAIAMRILRDGSDALTIHLDAKVVGNPTEA